MYFTAFNIIPVNVVLAGDISNSLSELNQLMIPEDQFNGTDTLYIDKQRNMGINAEYSVRLKEAKKIQIAYCLYFSKYSTDGKFGSITQDVGDYWFNLADIDREGLVIQKDAVVISCKNKKKCITRYLEKLNVDENLRHVADKEFGKRTTTQSTVELYVVGQEKQKKVLELFQSILADE